MSQLMHALFQEYLLEWLASAEMRLDHFEADLANLSERGLAADIRQSEMERRMDELRAAFFARVARGDFPKLRRAPPTD